MTSIRARAERPPAGASERQGRTHSHAIHATPATASKPTSASRCERGWPNATRMSVAGSSANRSSQLSWRQLSRNQPTGRSEPRLMSGAVTPRVYVRCSSHAAVATGGDPGLPGPTASTRDPPGGPTSRTPAAAILHRGTDAKETQRDVRPASSDRQPSTATGSTAIGSGGRCDICAGRCCSLGSSPSSSCTRWPALSTR